MDKKGGLPNLDNKRREVDPDRMKELEKNMERKMISKAAIKSFWSWFGSIADTLDKDFTQENILQQLDEHIQELGEFNWEIGPGIKHLTF